MVKFSSLDRPPHVTQSRNSFLQKIHRKHQRNSYEIVCGETEGEKDELENIISVWLEALHDSFPKADPSAALITHDRKANINQILGFFPLLFHCHISPSKEIGKNTNTNFKILLMFQCPAQLLSRSNTDVHTHCMSLAQIILNWNDSC